MIWLPTVWKELNEVIGSWKISAISPPRIDRICRPLAFSVDQVDFVHAPVSQLLAEPDLAIQ